MNDFTIVLYGGLNLENMKRILATICGIIWLTTNLAAEKEIIKSTLTEVTVYTQGAQLLRKANFNVKPGVTELIIEGISPNIDPRSLQVRALGNVVIIDSKYREFYPEPKVIPLDGLPLKIRKDIQILEDSIAVQEFQIREVQDEIDVLVASKSILANNGAIRGSGKVNDSIQLLKQAMDYYQQKMNELNKKLLVLNRDKNAKNRVYAAMQERLKGLRNYQQSNAPEEVKGPVHQIVITVQAKEAVAGKLSISYVASGASWIPSYDLRCDILTGKVNLNYKASISQETGESWDDVRITVSTNDPYQNKTKPTLSPWYLDYAVYGYGRNRSAGSPVPIMANESLSKKAEIADDKDYDGEVEEMVVSAGADEYTTVLDRIISAEFKIDLPYTIKSNGESHIVLINNQDLNAKFSYYTVPKIDPGVFLVAQLVKMDELQLVPATANIFFDGTYIGETYLDPSSLEDTLLLSMGKDPNIIVKRTLLKKEKKERIVGNVKERTFTYEIEVKNLKSSNVELVIEDQMPITQNGDIIIEKVDLDKADLDATTGQLTWRLDLKAKENKVIKYSYKVKNDKDKQVEIY